MKQVLAIVLLLCLFCQVGGCVLPAAGHYYYPETSNGSAVGAYCKNSMGPKNTLKLMLGNAKLFVSADRTDESIVHIGLQITGDQIVIKHDAFNKMNVYLNKEDPPLNKVNAKEVPLGIGFLYSFDIHTAPKQFVVQLPVIEVRGKAYSGITVKFTYKAGVWATVPNC